jgi:hypothetical protein
MIKIKQVTLLILITLSMTSAKITAPVPSIHDTVFTGKITVTLSCPDTAATIYYTTDGTKLGILGQFSPNGHMR